MYCGSGNVAHTAIQWRHTRRRIRVFPRNDVIAASSKYNNVTYEIRLR